MECRALSEKTPVRKSPAFGPSPDAAGGDFAGGRLGAGPWGRRPRLVVQRRFDLAVSDRRCGVCPLGATVCDGVATGLSRNDGSAALAAVIAYLITNAGLDAFAGGPVDTGAAGGVVVGLMVAYVASFSRHWQPPAALAFFSGPRLLAALIVLPALVLSASLATVWPTLSHWIAQFSHWVSDGDPVAAWGLYGVVDRLLSPSVCNTSGMCRFLLSLVGCACWTGKCCRWGRMPATAVGSAVKCGAFWRAILPPGTWPGVSDQNRRPAHGRLGHLATGNAR